ncbi:MAG: serine hydrolase [Minisyncoccia bacterium]
MTFPRETRMHWLPVLALCAGVLAGLLIGRQMGAQSAPAPAATDQEVDIRANADEHDFISPLIECANTDPAALQNSDANKLKSGLQSLISAWTAQGKVTEVSVYFRQMNDGAWFGIDGSAVFTPGSLLKVPVVMSVLHHAESDPGFIDKKITFDTPPIDDEQHYPPAQKIAPGKSYTVKELIESTLKYSDNNAAYLLANSIDWKELTDSFSDLGIQNPPQDVDATTTVQNYASFFRTLYNATYLNRDDSEFVLDALSQSTFTQGLVAGVPNGVPVSHKFGERELDTVNQLHDCGIVYAPTSPYLLCVMTRGDNYDDLASAIASISRTVYNSVNAPKQ